jgi:hypothetical protein
MEWLFLALAALALFGIARLVHGAEIVDAAPYGENAGEFTDPVVDDLEAAWRLPAHERPTP